MWKTLLVRSSSALGTCAEAVWMAAPIDSELKKNNNNKTGRKPTAKHANGLGIGGRTRAQRNGTRETATTSRCVSWSRQSVTVSCVADEPNERRLYDGSGHRPRSRRNDVAQYNYCARAPCATAAAYWRIGGRAEVTRFYRNIAIKLLFLPFPCSLFPSLSLSLSPITRLSILRHRLTPHITT